MLEDILFKDDNSESSDDDGASEQIHAHTPYDDVSSSDLDSESQISLDSLKKASGSSGLDKKEDVVNMEKKRSGKSTYLQQVCLIVILAQIGCYIPANFATLRAVDLIFTRMGAGDNHESNSSTGMSNFTKPARNLFMGTSKDPHQLLSRTLHQVFIVNACSGFRALWKVLRAFLDARTLAKLQVLGSNYTSKLLEVIDPRSPLLYNFLFHKLIYVYYLKCSILKNIHIMEKVVLRLPMKLYILICMPLVNYHLPWYGIWKKSSLLNSIILQSECSVSALVDLLLASQFLISGHQVSEAHIFLARLSLSTAFPYFFKDF